MSLNLWNGGADPEAIEALLQRFEPDVVGLQELTADQAEAVAAVMPYGLLEPRDDHRGMGIALRHPAEVSRERMNFRDLRVARLDPNLWPELPVAVEFATVHIAAPHIWPYGSGPWHRYRQARQVEAYLRENPEDYRVLVGDFNATPLWPLYRRIVSQLTDAAVAVAQVRGCGVQATWGPFARAPRVLRIDHAFARGLRAEEFQVVELSGSDHSAIVIDFSCPAGAGCSSSLPV